MIDPVLDTLPELSSDEEEEPPDPEELRRIQEREKIRELKRRRIHGGSLFFGLSGLGLRKADADAVYVREDQEDESAEVDIGMVDEDPPTSTTTPRSSREVKMEVDTPPTSIASPPSVPQKTLPLGRENRSNRVKRPSRKAEAQAQSVQASTSKAKVEPPPEEDKSTVDKRGKPRPETYKQAWSVSEQHLLERLLEEIPEGEKNRYGLKQFSKIDADKRFLYRSWSKISKAMNGRRTARQVASRVQKYYEKLKRFGLEVGTSSTLNNES